MSTFLDAILAVAATLPPVTPPPAPAQDDFGSDLSCLSDATSTFDELSGDDPEVVRQAFYRWLDTEPGELPDLDVKDWGGGLRSKLRKAATPMQLAAIPGQLKAKWFHDDDRTTEMVIQPLESIGDGAYKLSVTAMTAKGPFAFVATVSQSLVKEMSGP